MGFSFLESFDAPPPTPAPKIPTFSPEEVEAARQEGYSAGYGSGWEAAAAAAEADQNRITADFEQHLQDLAFTYHEARAHVMKGVEPLLREMLETILPAVMIDSLGHAILREIAPLAEEAADIAVRVAVAPQDADRLRTILGEETPIPLAIDEDESLASGQADLRLGKVERLIDLSGVLARISNALGAVEELNERSLAHA